MGYILKITGDENNLLKVAWIDKQSFVANPYFVSTESIFQAAGANLRQVLNRMSQDQMGSSKPDHTRFIPELAQRGATIFDSLRGSNWR